MCVWVDVFVWSLAGAIDRAEDAYSCATPGPETSTVRFCSAASWVDETVQAMIALTSCVCEFVKYTRWGTARAISVKMGNLRKLGT